MSKPYARYDVSSVVDAVSGVTLSGRYYSCLAVDTSGVLLWRGVDNTFVVSGGPNSAEHTLPDVKKRITTSVLYGVYVDWHDECQVLRFDIDPAPTVQPDRKASGVARVIFLLC